MNFIPIPAVLLAAGLTLSTAFFGPGSVRGEESTSWPFKYAGDSFRSDAMLDLRGLNEAEAGAHGFIKLSPDGNGFVTGQDNRPIRFWAVGCDLYRKTPAEMEQGARFLAKLGVNMIRLHTQISAEHGGLTDVNEKEIDGIWHMVAAAKKAGIYVTISPYWATGRDVTKWGIDGYTGKTDTWGLLFFNEHLQEGYKAWVKALYTRPNPYTNIPLAKDPAVGLIQVQNEDGLFFWTIQGLKEPQKKLLGQKFGVWLTKKYGSLPAAQTAWGNAANPTDDFANGVVGIQSIWNWTRSADEKFAHARNMRDADQLEFFAAVQKQFYADMTKYYRTDLGCGQLVNGSNWMTADAVTLNDVERYTNTPADVIAVNKYHTGAHEGKNNGWRIDPNDTFTNATCVLDPRSLPTDVIQPTGHPFIVTESTWVAPEGTQQEGPFLMAAYQSLTGMDVLYWFSFGDTGYSKEPYLDFINTPQGHPLQKWTCAVPAILGNFPAAALLYRRGYLKLAAPVVQEQRSLSGLWNREYPPIAEDMSFDPNRYAGKTGSEHTEIGGAAIDPLAFLVGPVTVTYGGDPAKSLAADLTKFIDKEKKIVTSVTGEVRMDYGTGLCTINAPKAQGAVGLLKRAGAVKLTDITLQSGNDEAAVLVVSLDDKPLAASGNVLVQVGTKARPTGWQTEPPERPGDNTTKYRIMNTGTMPWRMTNADVALTFRNPTVRTAVALDAGGYAAGDVPLQRQGPDVTLKVPPNTMYVILR